MTQKITQKYNTEKITQNSKNNNENNNNNSNNKKNHIENFQQLKQFLTQKKAITLIAEIEDVTTEYYIQKQNVTLVCTPNTVQKNNNIVTQLNSLFDGEYHTKWIADTKNNKTFSQNQMHNTKQIENNITQNVNDKINSQIVKQLKTYFPNGKIIVKD